jgi:hypothetical protein
MGKKKTKRKPPPSKLSEEYGRFKGLLRRLVSVPRKELEEQVAEYRERRERDKQKTEPDM